MNFCLRVESASLTFFIAQYLNHPEAADLADIESRTPLALSNTSESHHCSSTFTHRFVSDHVQPSLTFPMNYNSSNRCSLSPLSSLQNSFDISGYPGVGGLCESKVESENSWEYSPLPLSPDLPEAGNTLLEVSVTQRTQQTRRHSVTNCISPALENSHAS
jgi:hypothetical protein